MSLCHRCEHRAFYLENGRGPRCECKSDRSVDICYMYKPTMPARLKRIAGDKRMLGGAPMVSARAEFNGFADMELVGDFEDINSITMYWRPK